jgi:protein phosphatase
MKDAVPARCARSPSYGETTGGTDEFGLPARHNLAARYRGNAMFVYEHTPAPQPDWLIKAINIDTGYVWWAF